MVPAAVAGGNWKPSTSPENLQSYPGHDPFSEVRRLVLKICAAMCHVHARFLFVCLFFCLFVFFWHWRLIQCNMKYGLLLWLLLQPETQAVRDLVDRIKPTVFVTVHSGAEGLYVLSLIIVIAVAVAVVVVVVVVVGMQGVGVSFAFISFTHPSIHPVALALALACCICSLHLHLPLRLNVSFPLAFGIIYELASS